MADDLAKKGAFDRSRINVNEDWEVLCWSKRLGVSKEQRLAAASKGGHLVGAVRRELRK